MVEDSGIIESVAYVFNLDIPVFIAILMALSSITATLLPPSESNSIWSKIYKVFYNIIQICAMNVGKAKNKESTVNKTEKKNR